MAREVIFDVKEIQETLPHRYPFALLDKIIEFEAGRRIVGVKNVTMNEPFFTGHFPSVPVMPGVLILEAMAQAAAFLAMKSGLEGQGLDLYLVGAQDMKWKRQVVPGDTLLLEIELHKHKGPMWVVNAKAYVDGEVVASGRVSAAEVKSDT
ncbi:MAG: 3-hydroxyacyl-ACP dehydratase FabZ [Bdellovibrionales bacterium]|nr:3-hydroxyacyl-ACP dehydratase FabZ [Bdellovibrionales bacterium]